MNQRELFDFGEPLTTSEQAPYQRHSETSRAAAVEIEPKLNALQSAVLAYIASKGPDGATDDEIQCSLGMNPSTERPRRVELEAKRMIRKTDRQRPTRSGRLAGVYVAEPERSE